MDSKYLPCVNDEDYLRKESQIDTVEIINQVSEDANISHFFQKKSGYSFKFIKKLGQQSWIVWIQVLKGRLLITEIIESNCNIYYNQDHV